MFSLEQGKKLIKLARDSIESVLNNKEFNVSKDIITEFSDKLGCFVTLTIGGELRGCIGYPEPIFELYKGIKQAGVNAAFSDPRFGKLSKDEYSKVKVEVSVLTKPELIKVKDSSDYISEIKIGRDGLIIHSVNGSGLLLPQVFTEYYCDPEQALKMLCQKAGLNSDAWKDLFNKIYRFSAQIFKETTSGVVEGKLS
tara:strand:+ start:427 stop:1017 length:591 start_codon:yes stop_codon:yes gene_type:complete